MWKNVKILLIFWKNWLKKRLFFYKNERAHAAFICVTSIFIATKDHMYMYLFQKENVSLVWYYDIRHIFLEHSEKTRFFRKKCAFGCTYFCNKCCFTEIFTKPSYLLEINIGPIRSIILLKCYFKSWLLIQCDFDQAL